MARFTDRGTLGPGTFDFPYGIGAFFLGGTTAAPVLYAATLSGGGITAFVPDGSGGLIPIGSLAYPKALLAGVPPVMARFPVNGAETLLVSGLTGTALVTAPGGAPQGWTTYTGPASGALGALAPAAGGVLLAAPATGGLAAYAATSGGPAALSSVAGPRLSGIQQMPDGSLHAISAEAGTITRYPLTVGGALSSGQVAGALDGLGWSGPSAIRTADAGGKTYLVVAAAGSSSLTTLTFDGSVYRIADHIIDDRATRFAGVVAMDTATVNGRTFVAAGGGDDGVTLFELLPGGRLVAIQTFEDTVERLLGNVSAVSLFRAGGHLQLVVTGQEGGISTFSRPTAALAAPIIGGQGGQTLTGTGADDLIVGGSGNDILIATGGDNILVDGPGQDILRGGPGADIFVFVNDGVPDRVENFQVGIDRLDLSAFPGLYSMSDLKVTPVAGGARLVYGDEVIDLRTADGRSLGPGDLTEADILGVTRPPFVQIGRDLVGTTGPDLLIGADAGDRLRGLAGDDRLEGLGGRDVISGGPGADVILGGDGADFLMGGPGDDRIEGGAGADVISGGSGNDRIDGGPGNDTLRGGPGADVFVFRPGSGIDRIADFEPGIDRIDLTEHPGWTGWGGVAGALSVGAGGTVFTLGGGDIVLLTGVDPAMLSADDFLF